MKHIAFILLFIASTVSIASADIIEIKGRGIQNGRVISQNENEVQFEDSQGKKIVVPMAEVSILQKDSTSGNAQQKTSGMTWRKRMEILGAQFKQAFLKLKKQTDKITKKGTDYLSKPLDRSAVDARSASFAEALDDAGKAQAELAKKSRRVTEEIRRQQSEAAKSSKDYDGTKGRFGKL